MRKENEHTMRIIILKRKKKKYKWNVERINGQTKCVRRQYFYPNYENNIYIDSLLCFFIYFFIFYNINLFIISYPIINGYYELKG